MQDKKSSRKRQIENMQEKAEHTGSSIPDDNQNQNHNTKKVALGPNTKR